VGKVIGKKGAVITHIQLTTQTEVVVLTITEGSEHWSPVVITGEPFKALQAYELIKDIAEGQFPISLTYDLTSLPHHLHFFRD
jgi:rRNA processing protein Krr1/Pno1